MSGLFLADFSRRMDREGWSVTNEGKLTKNDKVLAQQIRATEQMKSGKNIKTDFPYMSESTIAYRKGRNIFTPNDNNVNTGRPLPNSKYPKRLQRKLDEKLLKNNNKLSGKKSDTSTTLSSNSNNITTKQSANSAKNNGNNNKNINSGKKLINKYTLGATGLLGVAGVGYAGYKYATRDKNKNNKKKN